jgi:hypothetical protein
VKVVITDGKLPAWAPGLIFVSLPVVKTDEKDEERTESDKDEK